LSTPRGGITAADIAQLDRTITAVEEQRPRGPGHPPRHEVKRYDFGEPELRRPGYVIPSPASLKNLSRVQLRDLVRRSGLVPASVCSVLTRLEMKLLLAETFPFTVGANYGVESRTINSWVDLILLCGDRRAVFNAQQAEQTRIRRREKLNNLGEAAFELDPREVIERRLAGKIFVLTDPKPIYLADRVAQRFYDIDGRAGRGSYYLFRERTTREELKISPLLWFETVLGDRSLMVHFRGHEHIVPPRQNPPSSRPAREPKARRLGGVENHFADFEVGA
jgi:hypothetical protein